MTADSEYVLTAVIREGLEFTLYRARRHGSASPLLVIAPSAERPLPQSLRRLEHEYALAAELDAAWAAKPLALTRHGGRTILVLADPGSEPLDRVLQQSKEHDLDLTHLLRIAIHLASALGSAHQCGLIHKDIKPENVLTDQAGGVWLTGFGMASRLPRERQAPSPPEIIAGTLAYMSPEQTGRMNRSMDTRSDLYSLGVTLYQMLTGVLPFVAADPLEWVHCHIARQPVTPADRRELPGPLSAITMKLLAKNAEERYQTAAALEADLRRCLVAWDSHGRIDSFPLGADDSSDRLQVPEKLYGREREVDALVAAFDRVVARGTPELVLVSGYSGVGKSSVVNELHKGLVPSRGLFASGKFDQYQRDIPYATLAQAFQMLARQILVTSEAEVAQWRRALLEMLGPNGQLIINLIPELEYLIGKQPPVPDLPSKEARSRFQLVFRRFLSAFATPEHPLALFLDDLQRLDPATLELLQHLLTDSDVQRLLLIGAYRDNEVSSSHPLMRMLAAIREGAASTQEIALAALGVDDVERLVAHALRSEPSSTGPLALLVHEKTGGNPFFAIQFLYALVDEALLVFDHGKARWSWDLGRIHAEGYSANVVDLMVDKLHRLSDGTKSALQQIAYLGNVAEIATLSVIFGQFEEEIHSALREAVRAGLILSAEGSYAFLHDRIQEAAYSLIPANTRAKAHLRIARLLLAHTPRERIIFEIVSHFNRSSALLTSEEEREQVAQLNLMAGKRAKNAAAYSSALTYFATGRALLADDCWTRQHPLTFALEFHCAECEFLTGELASAEERLSVLANKAPSLVDSAAVTCLRVDLYAVLLRSDRAVDVCLEYLKQVGIDWAPHPTDDDVRLEFERLWQRLGTRKIEDLIDLSLMADVGARATIDILDKLMPSTNTTDTRLTYLLITRMVNLSLEYGNSNASCCGYSLLSLVLTSYAGNYTAARRFGQLSLDLIDKRGLNGFRARVYLNFGIFVSPWAEHVRSGRALIQRAFDEANRLGDLTYAGYCCNQIVTNSLASGEPLNEVEQEAVFGITFAAKADFGLVIDSVLGQLCLLRTLRGQTRHFKTFNHAEFGKGEFEQRIEANPNLAVPACWYWVRKLQARVFAEDYSSALQAAVKAEALLWTSPAFFEQAEYHFYGALARAGIVDDGAIGPDERLEHLEALAAHHQQLLTWAEHCPENFENRAALAGAELARLEGREPDADRQYGRAIRSARANGFIHNEALASETAARFYAARGFEDIAEMYLSKARDGYLRWGADGKVRQLEARYPFLRKGRTPAPLAAMDPAIEQLDIETVVKAGQALSSEMVLPTLIEKLVRIAVEHAGAERGLLILIQGGEPRIEAEATTGPGRVEVAVRQAAITHSDLPQSALHYVIRTQECVLLDDASSDHVYSTDEYVRQRHSRSVLCLPIVKQGKLVGAFYLENKLTPCVFTPDRVTVLQLLASQAAISLENAGSIPTCNSRLGCFSIFLYPPGRSSLMGQRTS